MTKNLPDIWIFGSLRHSDFYIYMVWLFTSPAQKHAKVFSEIESITYVSCGLMFYFGWDDVVLRFRCGKEISYTFIAMDDRKAARKILHSIFRNKTTEKGRQIILFFEESLRRSGRMFACLQNKRKNAVKFLIFFSRIVLGVIYVPLLSLLPFKEDFFIASLRATQ